MKEKELNNLRNTLNECEHKLQTLLTDKTASEQRESQLNMQIETLQQNLEQGFAFEFNKKRLNFYFVERQQIKSFENQLGKETELSNTITALTSELESLKIELINRGTTLLFNSQITSSHISLRTKPSKSRSRLRKTSI